MGLCRRKLLKAFYSEKKQQFDISKVPDIYDSAKYDAIHNSELGLHTKQLYTVRTALTYAFWSLTAQRLPCRMLCMHHAHVKCHAQHRALHRSQSGVTVSTTAISHGETVHSTVD